MNRYVAEAFDIRQFLNGDYDNNCYYNCPADYPA
jgi:esterase/lipase superfamily enzyme